MLRYCVYPRRHHSEDKSTIARRLAMRIAHTRFARACNNGTPVPRPNEKDRIRFYVIAKGREKKLTVRKSIA